MGFNSGFKGLIGIGVFFGDEMAEAWSWSLTPQIVSLLPINKSSYRVQNNRTMLYTIMVQTEIISIRVSTSGEFLWTL